ncbi:hypothetical protein SDC9_146213 [bioreactor metagenome]|uniref:Uncharacterized protein n=1 Tax=bioreactor metagenome TaxID=1076179 RepID=A0A645EE31_9ZZZZ
MFRADVVVVHVPRFLGRIEEDFLRDGHKGNGALLFDFPGGRNLFFDFRAEIVEVDSHRFQGFDRHSFAQGNDPKQKVFGPHGVMIEPLGFFLHKDEHMPCPGSESFQPFIDIVGFCHN